MGSVHTGSRTALSFRAVNRRDRPDYDPGLQRHHLLPRQLLKRPAFAAMFAALDAERLYFEDFRSNGLLLPCREQVALRMGLPLHRGPHAGYSKLVTERVGQIEAQWAVLRLRDPYQAIVTVQMRIDLLQRALRRYLLSHDRRALRLNRRDSLPRGAPFVELDAMVDALWSATLPEPDRAQNHDGQAAGTARPGPMPLRAQPMRAQPMPARRFNASNAP